MWGFQAEIKINDICAEATFCDVARPKGLLPPAAGSVFCLRRVSKNPRKCFLVIVFETGDQIQDTCVSKAAVHLQTTIALTSDRKMLIYFQDVFELNISFVPNMFAKGRY